MNDVKPIFQNAMSARELVISKQSKIDFVENPHKPGSLFFVCGNTRGAISKSVQKLYNEGKLELDDMAYAETSQDNGATFVPCLMIPSTANVKKSFGENLLVK